MDLDEILRSALDPREWDPLAWPEKIRQAEAAILIEAKLMPGAPPRGKRPVTRSLSQRAKEMRAGGLSQIAISKALGISPGYTSKLLK